VAGNFKKKQPVAGMFIAWSAIDFVVSWCGRLVSLQPLTLARGVRCAAPLAPRADAYVECEVGLRYSLGRTASICSQREWPLRIASPTSHPVGWLTLKQLKHSTELAPCKGQGVIRLGGRAIRSGL
jgi:hypothetical protein